MKYWNKLFCSIGLSAGLLLSGSYFNPLNKSEIKVLHNLSGNIRTLEDDRALAILERDYKYITSLDAIIERLHTTRVEKDSILNNLSEKIVTITVDNALSFESTPVTYQSRENRFYKKVRPLRKGLENRLEDITSFIIYLESDKINKMGNGIFQGKRIILSNNGRCIALDQNQLNMILKYEPERRSLYENKDFRVHTIDKAVAETIHNSSSYLDEVVQVCNTENIYLEEMISFLSVETKGDAISVSTVGAIGPFQIMPYVARNLWKRFPNLFQVKSERELFEKLIREPGFGALFNALILKENGYPKRLSVAAYYQGWKNSFDMNRQELDALKYYQKFKAIREALYEKAYRS